MNRIPFLERLGAAFEDALREQPSPRLARERRPGFVWAAATFVAVLVVGAAWWRLVLRDSPNPVLATTVATDTTAVRRGFLPDEWARLPDQEPLRGPGRTVLSSVVVRNGAFIAVGSRVGSDTVTGIVMSSPDGVQWTEVATFPDASLHDVAVGSGGQVTAVGMRHLSPFAAFSADATDWTSAPVAAAEGEAAARMNSVSTYSGGFVAVGSAGRESGESRAAVWRSSDGLGWERVAPTSFQWAMESSIEAVTAGDQVVVAVGLHGNAAGASTAVAWVSTDGSEWIRFDLPSAYSGTHFVGASAVTVSGGGFVAAGFENDPTSGGATGAIWRSGDGRSWERIPDPDRQLRGDAATVTKISDLTPVDGGYVAVGHTLERPVLRHLVWTATEDLRLTRFDLAAPQATWPSSAAFSVAAGTDRVVAVGSQSDLNGTSGSAAIWVSPVPPGLAASVPVVEPAAEEDPNPELVVDLDPPVAVSATRVRASGRVPAAEGVVQLWLLGVGNPPIQACEVPLRGKRFICTFTPEDLGVGIGVYGIGVGASGDIVPGRDFEVVADGTLLVYLEGLYQGTVWPLLHMLTVRSYSPEPVGLSGWAIVDVVTGHRFVFPSGTEVRQGSSVQLDFSGPGGAACPSSTSLYFHWCSVVSDDGRISYSDDAAFWGGGAVELRAANDEVITVWERP